MSKTPPKTRKNQSAKLPLADYVTRIGAAKLAGVTEGAIRAAINRGELNEEITACGRGRLLQVADVENWAKQDRRPGRKCAATG